MKGNPPTRAVLLSKLLALLRPERVIPIALHAGHPTTSPPKGKGVASAIS